MNNGITTRSSATIELLAAEMATALKQERDPFRTPLILVPNGNLRKWLTLELTRTLGVTAGLDIRYLETGLSARLYGEAAIPLSDDALALLLDSVLAAPRPDAALAPLLAYCTPGGQVDPARRWQLARRLAGLFRDYGLHRHDMTEAWLHRLPRAVDALVPAQASLWRGLFAADGLLARLNKQRDDAGEPPLCSLIFSPPAALQDDTAVHIFGFSSISERHLQVIGSIAGAAPVSLYFLTPETVANDQVTPPILQETRGLWGRAAFGTHCLLHGLFPKLQPHPLTADKTPRTLLEAVQTALSSGSVPAGVWHDDDSLRITGCPGIEREVEVAWHTILAEMEQDPELELTDIALLTTDISTYLPALLSVFAGQELQGRRLDFNLSDTNAREESVYGQALLALLAAADDDLSRRDVFALLRNPAVQAGRGISEETADTWAEWTDGLRIFRHPDGPGTSWSFGLERLRLGQIMRPGDGAQYALAGRLPWQGRAGDNRVAAFSSFMDDLIRHWRALRGGARSAAAWKTALEALMDTFLGIPPDRLREAGVRTGLEAALAELLVADQAAGGAASLSLAVIRDFLTGRLEGIPVTRGQYLTDGVTISSLLPLRPVPFKLVFILGLQEGKFPGTSDDNTLDLRTRESAPRPSDVSTPEMGQALFLETLLSTRSKLFLSFVDRDLQKDQEFFPCSVLTRLAALAAELCGGEPPEIRRAPLKGYSARNLADPPAGPSYNPLDRLLCLKRLDEQGLLAAPLPKQQLQVWTPHPLPLQDEPEDTGGEELVVSLYQLHQFLKNPAQARVCRRIRTEITLKADSSLLTHPELVSGYDVRDPLFNLMIERVFAGADPLPAMEACHTRELAARQLTPAGPFRFLDWKRLEKEFGKILEGDAGLLAYGQETRERYGPPARARLCGREQHPGEGVIDIQLKPLPVSGARTVRITGEERWLRQAADGWAILSREYSDVADALPGIVQPLLFAAAATALGTCPQTTAVLIKKEKTVCRPLTLDPTDCLDYLTALVEDYLAPGPPEAFPLKGISSWLWNNAPGPKGKKNLAPEWIASVADEFAADFPGYLAAEEEKTTGVDEYIALTEAVVPADAAALLLRRILPLYRFTCQEDDHA